MSAPQVPDDKRVHIFDTTLRDGEQSPGISLNAHEKLEIAQQLARLRVDVIEAGFPITSPGDFEAVQAISREVEGPALRAVRRVRVAHRLGMPPGETRHVLQACAREPPEGGYRVSSTGPNPSPVPPPSSR